MSQGQCPAAVPSSCGACDSCICSVPFPQVGHSMAAADDAERCSRRCCQSSSVTAVTAVQTIRGHYRWEIQGFDKIQLNLNEDRITSDVFEVGDESWHLTVFPNGEGRTFLSPPPNWVSVKLTQGCTKQFLGVEASLALHGARDGSVQTFGMTGRYPTWEAAFEDAGYMDDKLEPHVAFVLSLTIHTGLRTSSTSSQRPPVTVPPSDLTSDLGRLLDSAEGFDVELRVSGGGPGAVRAHRVVLGMRSPVLRAMFAHPMREASSGVVEMGDVRLAVVRMFVRYLYTDELDADLSEHAQELLELSHQYQIPRLKALCEVHLCDALRVDTAASVFVAADTHGAQQLRARCAAFITEHLRAVQATDGWKEVLRQPDLLEDLLLASHGLKRTLAEDEEPGTGSGGGKRLRH